MQLPEKTFLNRDCTLYESDFECNGQVKPLRVMQLLQDVATDHAQQLGLGWHVMDDNGMLWVLSKIKIVFDVPVTRSFANFTLYTWPLAPTRFFAERCFAATANGQQLFSATSMWTIIDRDQRKILPAVTMNNFFHGQYSAVHSDTSADFLRVRLDEGFLPCHTRQIFRSDLDQNGHVNNTNYITYAVDVLRPSEAISALEIIYHKELHLGDVLSVLCKRNGNSVSVVGQRDGETCFTVVLLVE